MLQHCLCWAKDRLSNFQSIVNPGGIRIFPVLFKFIDLILCLWLDEALEMLDCALEALDGALEALDGDLDDWRS